MNDSDAYVSRFWKVIAVATYALTWLMFYVLFLGASLTFLAVYIPTLRWDDGTIHHLGQHLDSRVLRSLTVISLLAWPMFCRSWFERAMKTFSIPVAIAFIRWLLGTELSPPQPAGWRLSLMAYLRSPSRPVVPVVSVETSPPRSPLYGRFTRFSDN